MAESGQFRWRTCAWAMFILACLPAVARAQAVHAGGFGEVSFVPVAAPAPFGPMAARAFAPDRNHLESAVIASYASDQSFQPSQKRVHCTKKKGILIGAAVGFGVGLVVGARGFPGVWYMGAVGAAVGIIVGLSVCSM